MAANLIIIGSRNDAEAVAALQEALAPVPVTMVVISAEDSDDRAALAQLSAADAVVVLISDELLDSPLGQYLPAISNAAYQGNLVQWRILLRPVTRAANTGPLDDWTHFAAAADMAPAAGEVARAMQSSLELFEERPRRPITFGTAPAADAPRIFISHASNDGTFAYTLQARLESRGYRVWTDLTYMRTGHEWRLEIDDGLRGSQAVLVVISPNSIAASSYVSYEWAFAFGAGIPVLPILHQPAEIPPRLKSLQYLDFTAPDPNQWPVDRLCDHLRTLIAEMKNQR